MIPLQDPDTLFEEVAFVAYHFGWSRQEVLEMAHWERQRWCEEISDINEQMNEGTTPTRQQDQQGGTFLDADDGGKVLSKSIDDLGE
ncbi:hypothetical protein NDI56_13985 [Haloarcula sp. S1CR25-12]|uniref:DUF6760 domain-containing protein n=1 Tax=Haloarcula saliterrae TaxID=2950534 RepID=A0ABU2FFK2_9EURY|nr:DUF6760 family protein [Haloarcula sp. S1CR25-12]MDS0260511.1 hypothetical protein [Haloarcula sp. S1CR25-12]